MQVLDRTSEILSVVMPAYNESANMAAILIRLRSALPEAEIIVVDDGSSDATFVIAEQLASVLDIRLLRLEKNSGKGAAVKHGLEHATGQWVVIQDADLEYDPADINLLIDQANKANCVAVYGSRYKSRGHVRGGAWSNYVGVKLLALLEWILYGQWLSDPHTCYKMIRREVFLSMDIESQRFELCAEINSKLLRAGTGPLEVQITYSPRTSADGKKIRLRDFFLAAWTYIRFRFCAATPASNSDSDSNGHPWLVVHGYLASRLLIGCLLLVAAAMKLSPLNAIPIATWLVVPESIVWVWAICEFILGWACLTLVPHRLLHRTVVALLGVFLTLLTLKWSIGEQRCDCFGSLSLPLVLMAVIDMTILACLILFRELWQRPWSATGLIANQVRNFQLVLPVLLLASIMWFGSLDAARCFFAGDSLLVDSFSKFAGNVHTDDFVDVRYTLSNPSSVPVRVLGAKATCSCIAIIDLPTTIEPGQRKSIRLRVQGQQPNTVQRESAELIFDDEALRMVLNATAIVRPNH